jgi:hypothetical protein
VIAPPAAVSQRIAATEEVGAVPLFQLYAEHVSMTPQALAAGCEILQVSGTPCLDRNSMTVGRAQ